MKSDLLFLLRGNDLNLISREANDFKAYSRRGANAFAVLPNASGKNQKIDPAQQRKVGSDCFAYRSGENVQRKNGRRIIPRGTLLQRFHVALTG